ncbi:hypothetical protein FRC09_000019 [Ceratobasidium sp. 395]|nr:hypothetical protein FRC09_000019 [Ceratobasidium sp. 395]
MPLQFRSLRDAKPLKSLDRDPSSPVDVAAVAENETVLDTAVDDPAQAADPLTLAQMIADATEAANAYREKFAPYQWQLDVAS